MSSTPEAYTPQQLRHLSRIVKAEREVAAATTDALHALAAAVRDQLATDGYTATVLDSRAPVWREQLAEQIMPVIAKVYHQGFRSQTRATTAAIMPSGEAVPGDFGMADHLATQYLQTVHNRMVGVADDVFAVIAATLEEGRQATYTLDDGTSVVGDSIPQLAARVQAVLADNTRWSGDATRVARTEVIGANNAGAHAAAYNNAELFGTSSTQVIKEWLSTADERTRETHRIGGQKVLGLDTPFSVGGASLQQPGDPSGPAGETINCRCTALYHYPGDLGYDEMATELGALPGVTAAASPQEDDPMTTTPPEAPEVDESDGDEPNSVVVVALPAASDPVTGIGDEQKHATILFLGDVDENDTLTDDFRTALYALVAASAAAGAPTTENVTGVQSLGDDDARVWMLDAPDLTKLHDDWLKDPAVQAAWQGVEQYPTYTPHVTIGYPADTDETPEGAPEAPETPDTEEVLDAETEQAAAGVQSITFDRLAVWWAGEQTEWPLGAPADAAPASAPAAAALRLAGATWAEAAEQSGHPSALAARQAVRALFAAADDAQATFGKHGGKQNQYEGPGGASSGPAGKRKGYREAAGRAEKHDADAQQSMKSAKAASESSTAASHYRQAEQSAAAAGNAHEAARAEAAKVKDVKAQSFHEKGKKAAAQLEEKARKAAKRADETGQYGLDEFHTFAADDEQPLVQPMPETPGGPQKAQDIAEGGDPFHGILAPEDVVSGDNRMFAANSVIARDLPLPLMYQDATEDGHNGAVRVGRIDKLWRDTERYPKPMIRFAGVWDTSDTAVEAQRQVENKVLRGISVDGDQVTAQLVGSDGAVLDPMADRAPEDGVVIEQCIEARIDGGTLCSVPAFHQAYIANGVYDPAEPEPGQDEVAGIVKPLPTSPDGDTAPAEAPEDAQVASGAPGSPAPAWTLGLVAAASEQGPWVVPAAHFADPHLEGPTAMTVGEDGHVYGHLALWGTCHMGVAGKCMEPPVSASNYSFFATGVVHTDDGGTVNVGQLTIGTGHANLRYNARATVDHYDNTGTGVADVVMGHDTHGIWFSGHLRPEATPDQVYAMTAAGSVSGDWREVIRGSGQLELVAALVVNVPGYPIGRPALTASAHGPTALVASGMVQPTTMAARVHPGHGTTEFSDEAVADLTRRIMAGIAREQRLVTARARVRSHHAAALTARLNERV